MSVKAKKHLGQHFLVDKNICQKIANQYGNHHGCNRVLEIGPGMGALTEFLLQREELDLYVIDVDDESIDYLKRHYTKLEDKIFHGDFLRIHPEKIFSEGSFAVVGNFPYNISSQILFRCLQFRNRIPEIMGMFQKEVAERIAEPPGSKQYGILSVLMQAFYDIKYCFTVDEHVFNPPPKVKSGVIRCTRNDRETLGVNEELFIRVVKACFNQRRKTIRNSMKPILNPMPFDHEYLQRRPERMSVEDFIELTRMVESHLKK